VKLWRDNNALVLLPWIIYCRPSAMLTVVWCWLVV